MNFLPPSDARVLSTLEAIDRELVIDGFVYRFDPSATFGSPQLPIGAFEGAFLPATFWYAHALVGAGRGEDAAVILDRCEDLAGHLGIFAEAVDPQERDFLGNMPLVFARVEYARALMALQEWPAGNSRRSVY
jgi:GH15 family glucan-1,4-alpha-glucosidase